MVSWGHPDHDSPFSSNKESGPDHKKKSGKDSACALSILLPVKKGTGICSFRSKETMLSTFLDFFLRKEWIDSLPFFLKKIRTGLSCIFQDQEWEEWARVSLAPCKDAEDFVIAEASGGPSSIPSREKSGVACSYPPSFPDKQWRHWGGSLLPSSQKKTAASF